MPPRISATLTEAELRLMEILWQRGPSTVQQLVDSLPENPLAYNSVLTTIRILEKKGYVDHQKDGRAHIYETVVGRREAARSEVQNVVRRMFGNSHELLLLNVLEEEQIDLVEIDRLRQMLIDRARQRATEHKPTSSKTAAPAPYFHQKREEE